MVCLNRVTRILVATGLVAAAGAPAMAGSHLWRINEAFSNSDGTIQFIEMMECCGAASETALFGKWVLSDTTANQFDFPANLTGNTANRHLLLATSGFAALPGAPTPDHIIPDGFFSTSADTLTYWMYPAATMTFAVGALPLDGINALNADGTTGVNSPTNYAGDSGSVDASGVPVPTVNEWGMLVTAMLLLAAGTIILARRGARFAASRAGA